MEQTLIEGVLVTPESKISNPRGDLMHAMKCSSAGYNGFGEAYFSSVNNGEIKGWKRHNRLTLNIVVPVGNILFVIYDDRASSATRGCFKSVEIGVSTYARLTVPPGLWLAFKGLTKGINLLMNIIEEEHDPLESDNLDIGAITYFEV